MGFILHDAIIVSAFIDLDIERAHAKAIALGLPVTSIFGPVLNGYRSFLVVPEGSKEGWEDPDGSERKRSAFLDWMKLNRYPGGSNLLDFCIVEWDEKGSALARSMREVVSAQQEHVPMHIRHDDEAPRANQSDYATLADPRGAKRECAGVASSPPILLDPRGGPHFVPILRDPLAPTTITPRQAALAALEELIEEARKVPDNGNDYVIGRCADTLRRAIDEAQSADRWSPTPPTEPGLYWVRRMFDAMDGPTVVEVEDYDGKLVVLTIGQDEWRPLTDLAEAEWLSGRVQEPTK